MCAGAEDEVAEFVTEFLCIPAMVFCSDFPGESAWIRPFQVLSIAQAALPAPLHLWALHPASACWLPHGLHATSHWRGAGMGGPAHTACRVCSSAPPAESCPTCQRVHLLLPLRRTAVLLVEAGLLEGLARWASQQLRCPVNQHSDAAKGGVVAAGTILVRMRHNLAGLLAERQPPGISHEAIHQKMCEEPHGEGGDVCWLSAPHWDAQVRRRLLPLMREVATSLK